MVTDDCMLKRQQSELKGKERVVYWKQYSFGLNVERKNKKSECGGGA